MPEGHTIHRIARDHRKWFANHRVGVYSPQGRFETEAKKINNKRLRNVSAHGKHLFYHYDQDLVHVHLGLYGKFRLHLNPAPDPRGAVRVRMIAPDRTFDLNGPNCCELIDASKYQQIKARLGQDPLLDSACPETVWNRMRLSRSAIGTILLNQSIISGVGNVYRAEILFLLGIHPERPGHRINRPTFDQLWQLTTDLLKIGVKYNRIITVNPAEAGKAASRLSAAERLNVYKRPNCPKCNSRIQSWELGNRTIYACKRCQRN